MYDYYRAGPDDLLEVAEDNVPVVQALPVQAAFLRMTIACVRVAAQTYAPAAAAARQACFLSRFVCS